MVTLRSSALMASNGRSRRDTVGSRRNRSRLPNPLADLLKRLAGCKDLAQPINDLLEILREGGREGILEHTLTLGGKSRPRWQVKCLTSLASSLDYLMLAPQAVAPLRQRP